MPHLTLEYTHNLAEHLEPAAFFADVARTVAELEGFVVADLKGRARCLDAFFVGDPAACQAFAHLDFRLLTGRDISVRQRLCEASLRLLGEHTAGAFPGGGCQLSVEVREMDRSTYGKARGEAREGR